MVSRSSLDQDSPATNNPMSAASLFRPITIQCDELQFVNLFGTAKNSKQKAKTVRSHVMRLVRKQQASRQRLRKGPIAIVAAERQRSPRAALKTSRTSNGKFNLTGISSIVEDAANTPGFVYDIDEFDDPSSAERSDCSTANLTVRASSPIRFDPRFMLSRGDSDPFDAFPVPFTHRVHQLLHFTTIHKVRTSVHEDPQHAFSSGVGSDPTLLFTTLGFAAAHLGRGNPAEELESAIYLQKALRLMNQALSSLDSSGLGVRETMIAAVACLSNMESLNGDRTKAVIHMRGLKSMVKLKGGLDSLGMNGTLRRLVLWADLCLATRWNCEPLFPPLTFPILLPLSFYLPPTAQAPERHVADSLINITISNLPGLLPLFQDLHELSYFLDSTDPKDVAILHDVAYADRSYLMEYTTLTLISQRQPSLVKTEGDGLILPLLLQAILLYIYTNIRLTPVGSSLRYTLVSRIKDILSIFPHSTIISLIDASPHEMAWIIFLAGSASLDEANRNFFVEKLAWISATRALGDWQDASEELRRFLWLHAECLGRCEDLWKEVLVYKHGWDLECAVVS